LSTTPAGVDDLVGVGVQEEPQVVLVPVEVGGQTVFMSVRDLDLTVSGAGEELPISGRRPRLEHVLEGLAAFAGQLADRFEGTGASKVSVEFGCEVALESGTLIAVIGKASATSTITVGLEWSRADS
jgi:hypothetical protein